MMLSSPRSSIHNQKAKLAADYNDLLKQLSSPKMTVVGCYSIGETIGEGTYGKVKLGVHQITGKRVAIKKISKQHAPLMAREIHHHRQLRHPNIITLFEILSTESAIFIVSEYCPNGELFDLLTESGRFSEQRAQAFFRQLVDAIRYCHERNIVHRDLKLENILLDADQNAKICDFGFARHADDKQLLETFCGSLAYSAPEIISQKRYTGPETDIWSLGIILYTLLAGELPFDDDSEIIMRRKIIGLDYHLPSYFSPEAQDLIENILKLDPKERLTMDQIVNHPWLTMIMDDDDDDDEEVDGNDNDAIDVNDVQNNNNNNDDCSSVPSTRCSAYSDVDSLFSAPMRNHHHHNQYNNNNEDDDDFDLYSDISSPRSSTKPGTPLANQFYRPPSIVVSQKMMPHEKAVGAATPTTGAAKFTASRPPRFSAPTVSSRARITQPYFASSARASLPSHLPSSALAGKHGSLFAHQHHLHHHHLQQQQQRQQYEEPAMAPMEQRLFAALTAAGFDESTVRNMRQSSDVGNALGTLWHMLMDNMSKNEPMVSGVAVPANNNNNKKKASDGSAYQVVEKGTQTDDVPPPPSSSSSSQKQQQQLQPPPSPVRPTVSEPLRPAAPPAIPITSIEGHPKVSVSSTQSRSTASSASEKSGWFSSVKSWFGTSKQQQQHHEEQQQQQQRLHAAGAAFRVREIQESSPAYPSGANQKYRRHVLQLPNSTTTANQQHADPFSYNNNNNMPHYPALARPQAAHNKPSLDSYYKAGSAFGPARPPTALTCSSKPPAAVVNTVVVKPPPPTSFTSPPPPSSSTTAVSTTITTGEVKVKDVCEKRYAQSYRSANRPVSEQQQQAKPQEHVVTIAVSPAPQQQQRPLGIVAPKSPVPTTTASTPVTPIRTISPSGTCSSPLSSQASSLVEEDEDEDDEEASSPASSISTVDTPEEEEEDNNTNSKNSHGSSSISHVNNNKLNVPPPSPTPTRSWPLAFRENNNASAKRFDFAAPRSQLGIYNDAGRRKPLGAKVIIEEEEEEEEE